jgi:hypothetical protein
MVLIKIDLTYKGEKHKADAYGIKTEHVNAPVKAWEDYMRGIPYDWTAVNHPDHTPEGYLKFVKWAKKVQKEHSVETEGSYKVGDVMWSCRRNRFFLCDID